MNGFDGVRVKVADFAPIDGKGDVVRSPLHLVDVPVIVWVEVVGIVMHLLLLLSIAVDDVGGEGVLGNRGHNLDIQLVPASRVEARTIPVSEEGGDCSLAVWCLHASDELAVGELFVSGDRSAPVAGLSNADHGEQRHSKSHVAFYLFNYYKFSLHIS